MGTYGRLAPQVRPIRAEARLNQILAGVDYTPMISRLYICEASQCVIFLDCV